MNENCVIHDIPQGTEAWRMLRKGLVTGSERGLFAAKTGFETYVLQKEAERFLNVIEHGYTSPAMENGTELEPIARDIFAQKQLVEIEVPGFISRIDLNAGFSPDGLFDNRTKGIEIKCRNAVNHYRVLKEGLDVPTYQQIQFAMAITDIELFYYVGFNPDFVEDKQMVIIEVPRSEAVSTQILGLIALVKQRIGL
jgi:hypothetical protein